MPHNVCIETNGGDPCVVVAHGSPCSHDIILRLAEKYEYDLEDMLGEDDEDFLENLVSFAAEHGIDLEDSLLDLGVPLTLVIDGGWLILNCRLHGLP